MKTSWAGGILTIDLDAIAANYHLLRDLAAPALAAAVVKADAYGLGACVVAARLEREGCRHFFVAHLHEGALLRASLSRESVIHILNGPPPGTCGDLAAHGLVPVLNSMQQIVEWRAHAAHIGRPLPAAIQFDTGMSRFGLSGDEVRTLAAEPARLDGVMPILLMSHLGCADTPDHPLNARQHSCFAEYASGWPHLPASLAASSGSFLGASYHFDMIRPGAALFGVNPTPGRPNPMRPAIRLQGRIVQSRWIEAGTAVGYGARFTATAPTRIATVAVGYADGFLRASGEHGAATLSDGNPAPLPIAGRLSMDCLALDVTILGDTDLAAGTAIDLIGPHRTLDDAAAAAGTIGYEILTALGSRYHRHYLGDKGPTRPDGAAS